MLPLRPVLAVDVVSAVDGLETCWKIAFLVFLLRTLIQMMKLDNRMAESQKCRVDLLCLGALRGQLVDVLRGGYNL